jgi:hypothetical protein
MLSMLSISVLLCLLQAPTNPVRIQENTVAMARSGVAVVQEPATADPHPYVQYVQVRQFEAKFNELVKAVEEFSRAYNGNHGQVWPAAKAEALRKAMAELQKSQPSLSAKR